MAEITATLVKQLRDMTGAGMMDCKQALKAVDGEIDKAVDWLREKGLSKAAKKAGRAAAEGLVGALVEERGEGMAGTLVEINAETDFVARNDLFQEGVREISRLALKTQCSVEALADETTPKGISVAAMLKDLIATIGENMTLRRLTRLSVPKGVIASYLHNAATEDMGRLGVLVALQSEGDKTKLMALGRQIAMHVAALKPLALKVEDLKPEDVERERHVLYEQARASGRPEAVIEKMVTGRLRKFYEESVLLEQAFVMDTDKSVAQVSKILKKI